MSRWREKLTSQVTAVCVVVLLADITFGTVGSTFSLFAEQIGIAVAVIGVINMLSGFASLSISLPAGSLSDRIGRPVVVAAGLVMLALGPAVLAVADSMVPALVGQIFATVGLGLVVRTASAHLGDVTKPGRRALAFSFFSTSLGCGFTIGSFLSGQLSEHYGFSGAYVMGAGAALLALVTSLLFLRSAEEDDAIRRSAPRLLDGFRRVARHRPVQLASIASLLSSLTFSGAILTVFPLYAKELGVTTAAVGTLFAVRGVVTTSCRIPNGFLVRWLGDYRVMVSALALEGVVMFGIWMVDGTGWLMVLFAIEGLTFGGYTVASQIFIAEAVGTDVRGAAVGFSSMISGVGSTLGPVLLGVIGAAWGVEAAFPITGLAICVGVVIILIGRATSPALVSAPATPPAR